MTRSMPFFAREFHLHPSDFGGDRALTYAELNAFLEAGKEYADDLREQERKMKQSGRRGRRR